MIIGHQKIISQLEKAIEKGNLHHAYLFTGPEHVGKFTVAIDWAEKILGNIKETNPDLIKLQPECEEKNGIVKKKAISVEDVRELQRKIVMAPTGGKYKLAIIDEAEYLNKAAQNALLKTLEEPPVGVILILVTGDKEKLLPTILSRCQTKKFNAVSPEEMGNVAFLESDREDIIFWSLGRPGLGKIFSEDKAALKERMESRRELQNLLDSDVSERFAVAEALSKNTIKLTEKLSWWMVMLRENTVGGREQIKISRLKALKIMEKTGESIEMLKNTNSNARLVLENLMLEF